MKCIELVATQ